MRDIFIFIFLAFSTLFLVSCGGGRGDSPPSHNPSATERNISITPPSSNFYSHQLTNTTSPAGVWTITNTGNVELSVSEISTGPGFNVVSNTCVGMKIPAGGNCTANITFSPLQDGDTTAPLSVTYDGITTITFIGGSAGTLPTLIAGIPGYPNSTTTGFIFINQTINIQSSPQTVSITNKGYSDLVISNITISGVNASNFAVSTTNCIGTINVENSCSLSITFTPTSAGTHTASVDVTSNIGTTSLSLYGDVSAPAVLLSGPSFANQAINTTSGANTFSLLNVSNIPFQATSATITGSNATSFQIVSDTCSGNTVNNNQSCSISLIFAPTVVGNHTATLSVSSNAGQTTVALSGVGI